MTFRPRIGRAGFEPRRGSTSSLI